MAEFEELRLTVNLVDNASAGLQRLRAEIGQLTQSTTAMTASLVTGVAAVQNFGTLVNNAAPGVRALSQNMTLATQSARRLTDGMQQMAASTQGLHALPQLANGIRQMAVGVHGLGSAFSLAGTAASVMAVGLAAVAVAVVGLGAVIVAYGVSVFKFAKEMNDLGKTAKYMGMGFADLKYAQDQARRYGQSAEAVTRSYQGIQAAQFDLYKNNSQLRQRLLAQGVDAGWIAQLQTLDPNQSRNAIIRYGKALEAQALASGAGANVAAALKNQFGKEFGLSKEDMAGAEIPEMSPQKRAELEKIATQSEQVTKVWREITHQWSLFSKEILAAGLPAMLESMRLLKGALPKILPELKIWMEGAIKLLPKLVGMIPAILRRIAIELKGVIMIFQMVIDTLGFVFRFIRNPKEAVKGLITGAGKGIKNQIENAHPAVKQFFGVEVTDEYQKQYRERQDKAGKYTFWDKETWGGGTPSEQFYKNQGLIFEDPAKPSQQPAAPATSVPLVPMPAPPAFPASPHYQAKPKLMSHSGGANDNNPLLVRAAFTQRELRDTTSDSTSEIVKLTGQFERLNDYFDRVEGRMGGAGGGGFQNATLTTGGGPGGGGYGTGGYGGGGQYGGASTGGYGAGPGAPAGVVDQDGKGIDPETMKQVEALGRAGDTAGLKRLFDTKGYRMSGPACGIVASKYVMSAGFKPPPGGAIASNWNEWGQEQSKADINNPDRPFGSMVASYKERRYGGNVGAPLGKGQTGGHVMTIVPGSYNPKTNTALFVDQYGVRERNIKNMDLRYAGDTTVAEVRAKRAATGARVDGVGTGGTGTGTGTSVGGGSSGELIADRAKFRAELDANPALREKILRIAANEQGRHGLGTQAVLESMMNRASMKGRTLEQEAKWTGEGGYYAQGNMGRGALESKEHAAVLEDSLNKVLGGSNITDYATDNASQGLAAKRKANREMEWTRDFGGKLFFRPGQVSGQGNVRKHAAWMAAMQTGDAAARTAVAANVPPPRDNVVPLRPGPTVERAALNRDALTADKTKVETDGKLKADVDAPAGTKVEVEGSGAFKKTETERSNSGGMSKETARRLLAV